VNSLSWTWEYALPFVVVLGTVVLFHEFGHYLCAKLFGITVEVFSIGFGPKIVSFRRGGTEYRIAWIPLGGYVKLKGETPEDGVTVHDPSDMMSRPRWQRFLVFVMGAVFNIATAFVLTAVVFMSGVREPAYLYEPPIVGVIDEASPAKDADIKPGDRILSFDGQQVSTWKELDLQVLLSPRQTREVVLERDGRRVVSHLEVAADRNEVGIRSLFPNQSVIAGMVQRGWPADEAGLEPGDRIVAIDGIAMNNISLLIKTIHAAPGRPLEFTIERKGETFTRTIVPRDADGNGMIGFSPTSPTVIRTYGFLDAMRGSLYKNLEDMFLVFDVFRRLLTMQLSVKTFSGPIGIFLISGDVAQAGLVPLLQLIAFISLQLGIINLLPIPPLDGGHLFTITIEGMIRRDLPMRLKERVMQAGFLFLLLFMGTIIYFDISKYFFR
jgi:regulator of sigma E protease